LVQVPWAMEMSACPVCDGTQALLAEPCPLCCDAPLHREGSSEGKVDTVPVSWCKLCSKDLQSAAALAEHVRGRKHLYRMGARPERALQISEPLSEESFFGALAGGRFRRVLVFTGAGVSTAAGIPDFRSAGGMFEQIRDVWGSRFPEVLTTPEMLLSRQFVKSRPSVWRNEVEPWLRTLRFKNAAPTSTHWFCSWLHRQGWLRRVYTQNIDGLHVAPELAMPPESVVECHGALRDASVVLYGDSLPVRVDNCCRVDMPYSCSGKATDHGVDLVLVFGTSLQVAPFCALPNMAPAGCARVLVTLDVTACLTNNWCPAQRRSTSDGYYSADGLSGRCFASTTAHLGDWKAASLRPLWGVRRNPRRWRQLLVESDCDSFVDRFFASPAARAHGLTLEGTSPCQL